MEMQNQAQSQFSADKFGFRFRSKSECHRFLIVERRAYFLICDHTLLHK